MDLTALPRFPYGAVYFRKTNPPREDWARDYHTAAADGMNIFRHWFMWGSIETAPGVYDWADYDRQLDLAVENGIRTIIAEQINAAPEWAFRQFGHARYERADGRRVGPQMGASSATGGWPGLCYDNDDAREAAGRFITALAARYRGHPGLAGYDIWNECNSHLMCYCPATVEKFRGWLRAKYGDLKALGEAWYRYSFAGWADVQPPRDLGPYPDTLDWLQFRVDNAYRLMRWRIDTVRAADPDHAIIAHGVAGSLVAMADAAADEWRAASEVEAYGFTFVASRKGSEAWKQWQAVDLVRAGARGKPFWHAEAQAGPLWMQPQVIGRPREDGRITQPEDIRLWNMVSFAGGATGWLCPRWRPLLDGPLFGAFGGYNLDGSRNARTEMMSKLARWANAPETAPLWQAPPVRGDVGIVWAPESQFHCYSQQHSTDYYAKSAQGAYQGFFDNNIQPDFVHVDDIDQYRLLYLPYPVMLTAATAARLKEWVRAGGTLISEGCPGYFGDRGKAGQTQPHNGLAELFGCNESYVEFTPDLLGDLTVTVNGRQTWGGLYLQAYEPTTGSVVGLYPDGRVAAVENRFGNGRTLLIGTFPGYGHAAHYGDTRPAFFAGLLEWAGVTPHVRTTEPRLTARLHRGGGRTYLWVTNPIRADLSAMLTISDEWGPFAAGPLLWGARAPVVEGRRVGVEVGARDALVVELVAAE